MTIKQSCGFTTFIANLLLGCPAEDADQPNAGTTDASATMEDDSTTADSGSAETTTVPGPDVPAACQPDGAAADHPVASACVRYYSVLGCCGALDFSNSDGDEPWTSCIAYSERAAECPDRITAVTTCVVEAAAESCTAMEDFFQRVYTDTNNVGPPTDPSTPCYDEVIASWDAGCNWPPY